MTRIISFILGLAFVALGFLGITNFVPVMSNNLIYLNIAEIVLGILGLLFGMYSPKSTENARQRKENLELKKSNEQHTKESLDQIIRENEQLKKMNEQLSKESSDQLIKDNEQLKKELEQSRVEMGNQANDENSLHS